MGVAWAKVEERLGTEMGITPVDRGLAGPRRGKGRASLARGRSLPAPPPSTSSHHFSPFPIPVHDGRRLDRARRSVRCVSALLESSPSKGGGLTGNCPPDYLLKVVVIGESGTGKSCLLHQFLHSTCPSFLVASCQRSETRSMRELRRGGERPRGERSGSRPEQPRRPDGRSGGAAPRSRACPSVPPPPLPLARGRES